MQDKIKILHVLGDLNVGGIESLLISIFNNIDRRKFEFDFLVHKIGSCENYNKIKNLGGNIYTIEKFNPKKPLKYKRDLEKFLSDHSEYKILHCHFRGTESTILKAAKKYGLTTISHSHGINYGHGFRKILRDYLKKDVIKYSDYKFACSIAAGEFLFDNNDFTLIKNGIDLEKYVFNNEIRNKIKNQLNLRENKVLVHVGSCVTVKSHEFLIFLMKDLVKFDNNIKLLLLGDGELRKEMENLVNKLSLDSNIIFMGSVTNVNEILQASDIFLLPSLNEGLPLSAVEAQSSGLKCLLSNNIPKDAKITKNVKFISIDDKNEWIKSIINNFEYERENLYKIIDEQGFNILSTSKFLEEFYKNLI